jgi:hypothetical protein
VAAQEQARTVLMEQQMTRSARCRRVAAGRLDVARQAEVQARWTRWAASTAHEQEGTASPWARSTQTTESGRARLPPP